MNILLAILSGFVFLVGMAGFFSDFGKKFAEMEKKIKDLKVLEEKMKKAEQNHEVELYRQYRDEWMVKGANSCFGTVWMLIQGAFILVVDFVLTVFELVVIIWALAAHVGNPYIGYAALAAAILGIIVKEIRKKMINKEQEIAKLKGEEVSWKNTPFYLQALYVLPEFYAAYVVAMIFLSK